MPTVSSTQAQAFGTITVSNTALAISAAGLGFTAVQLDQCSRARITCLTQPVVFRYDDSASALTTAGHYLAIGQTVIIDDNWNVKRLFFLRGTGVDGVVTVTLEG